ncbi:MAG: DNA polymerase IV [Candidatus Omnitrophica bacterium]|nr:DNA polymerase IV [Candidatus Omnitrophota bacterium]
MSSPIILSSWPHVILHVDGDAFFASCEQSVHPELKGKAVITGKERNIVASLSYEAKACGIKRGTPIWEVKKLCPTAIILPSDYETYSLISKRMFSIMRRFTPVVEESSIDEGYADLKGLRRLHRMGYGALAGKIKETIEGELDIPVSIGVSLTKTLAKLAAKHEKPRGLTIVKGGAIHQFVKKIPVREVCGIGPNISALLHKHGVHTAFDYATRGEMWIKRLLGKTGVELWHELRGEKVYELNAEEKTTYQSISKSKTFTPPSDDYAYVKAQLFRNVESAFIKLRRYHLRAQRFIVYLRTQDFKGGAVQSDFNRGAISVQEVFPHLEKMLQSLYQTNVLYRATGIVLTHLEEDSGIQFELFEDPLRMIAMHRLAHSIDAINAKYGKHTVFSGTGLFLKRDPDVHPQMEGRCALPKRKTDLLGGETFRKRISMPLWQIRV